MRLRGLHGIDLVEINYVEYQVLPQNNAHIILKILPTKIECVEIYPLKRRLFLFDGILFVNCLSESFQNVF